MSVHKPTSKGSSQRAESSSPCQRWAMSPRFESAQRVEPAQLIEPTQLVEPTLWSMLEQCARELARLIVPLSCVGCAEPDHVLCPNCAAHFLPAPTRAEHLVPRLAGAPLWVWTCGMYAEPLNYVIMNWKDGRRLDATKPLTAVIRNGAQKVAEQVAEQLTDQLTDQLASASDQVVNIVVVPLPSSARSRRIRGFVPAQELAYGVVDGLNQVLANEERVLTGNFRVSLGLGLKVATTKVDQVGLDSRKRAKNLSGTLKAGSLLLTQCYVASVIVLVDDLVTTGATMREAMRVLPRQSGTLVAGISLCVTPARVIV